MQARLELFDSTVSVDATCCFTEVFEGGGAAQIGWSGFTGSKSVHGPHTQLRGTARSNRPESFLTTSRRNTGHFTICAVFKPGPVPLSLGASRQPQRPDPIATIPPSTKARQRRQPVSSANPQPRLAPMRI